MEISLLEEDEMAMTLLQLMPGGKAYAREKRSALRRVVAEVYSPPRVTKMLSRLPNHDLIPGMAFDLTVMDTADGKPWDFDIPEKRERARALLRKTRPLFLIGTPMCTAFSTWQRLNDLRRDPAEVEAAWKRAMVHLQFVASCIKNKSTQIDTSCMSTLHRQVHGRSLV